MNYAVRKLNDELQDQLLIIKSFETKTPKTESIEKVITITARRIKELNEALTVLLLCAETHVYGEIPNSAPVQNDKKSPTV